MELSAVPACCVLCSLGLSSPSTSLDPVLLALMHAKDLSPKLFQAVSSSDNNPILPAKCFGSSADMENNGFLSREKGF